MVDKTNHLKDTSIEAARQNIADFVGFGHDLSGVETVTFFVHYDGKVQYVLVRQPYEKSCVIVVRGPSTREYRAFDGENIEEMVHKFYLDSHYWSKTITHHRVDLLAGWRVPKPPKYVSGYKVLFWLQNSSGRGCGYHAVGRIVTARRPASSEAVYEIKLESVHPHVNKGSAPAYFEIVDGGVTVPESMLISRLEEYKS